jgi:hypothetical protein
VRDSWRNQGVVARVRPGEGGLDSLDVCRESLTFASVLNELVWRAERNDVSAKG